MAETVNWLERLSKWRTVLTGRLLGTRLITDQQGRAARDLFDKVSPLKADSRTLQQIITTKEIATVDEFAAALRPSHEAQKTAVTDIFTDLLRLRAEVNAISFLLFRKGVMTEGDYESVLQAECQWLCEQYEEQFPGFKAIDAGLSIDPKVAAKTTQGWPA